MAIHSDLVSLLHESLPEYLAVAKDCCEFRELDGGGVGIGSPAASGTSDQPLPGAQKWQQAGACRGYAAALLLFSILDAIGSFYRNGGTRRIPVDGKDVYIDAEGFKHFYMLNSDYYGAQKLNEGSIKILYRHYRCLLSHNAALAPQQFLLNRPQDKKPFPLEGEMLCVNIPAFFEISATAVQCFLRDAASVVPWSVQAECIAQKRKKPSAL